MSAKSFEVPALSDGIVVFDRHLERLLESTRYIAISHVWSRDVAEAQNMRQDSTSRAEDVARTISEVPARVCKGLIASLGEDLELWHDYISVPQWRDDAKKPILESIHRIFERAMLTTVYSADLHASTCEEIRQGSTAYARCCAISDICNIKHFSRVWTAMEYTQSRKVCFMTGEFKFLSDNVHDKSADENLFTHMTERWELETQAQEKAHSTEQMVGMGYNLVPWQLGPLEMVRRRNSQGLDTTFGNAHALLGRRCVTIERDYLYALQGILKLDLGERTDEDMTATLRRMVRACLQRGDFSPLLMIPADVHGSDHAIPLQSLGFHDVLSFGLGAEERGPTYADVGYDSASGRFALKAERLGRVERITRMNWGRDNSDGFALEVRLVLETGSSDVDDFVRSLGGRLFGQDTDKIQAGLSEDGRREVLKSKLECLSDTWSRHSKIWDDPETTFELIHGESPILRASSGAGNSFGQISFDLAACLGNSDGRFDRASGGFHLSARALELTGTKLQAELRTVDSHWKHDEIDVRTLALYPAADGSEEHLDWIADAMGLSNRALKCKMTQLSPVEFLRAHGGTLHGGHNCGFASIVCTVCHRSFLVRAALFSSDEPGPRMSAWRIPGLKYEFTLEGGAGFLLNGEEIIGRFIWAAQTCDCDKVDDVEVILRDPPMPKQNMYEYGKSRDDGWIPL